MLLHSHENQTTVTWDTWRKQRNIDHLSSHMPTYTSASLWLPSSPPPSRVTICLAQGRCPFGLTRHNPAMVTRIFRTQRNEIAHYQRSTKQDIASTTQSSAFSSCSRCFLMFLGLPTSGADSTRSVVDSVLVRYGSKHAIVISVVDLLLAVCLRSCFCSSLTVAAAVE